MIKTGDDWLSRIVDWSMQGLVIIFGGVCAWAAVDLIWKLFQLPN